MGDESGMYFWAGILLGAAALIAFYTGTFSGDWVWIGGLLAIGGGVLFRVVQSQQWRQFRDQLSVIQGSGLSETKTTHELWEDLQDWAEEDPRDMELVWEPLNTDATVLPIPADDPQFYLQSILAKDRDSSEEIHIVVEMQTGYIIHYMSNDKAYNYDKNQPFNSVPFVAENRFVMMLDIMERREVKRKLQNMASGQLPGGYQTPADEKMKQALEEMQEEGGEVDADAEFED